MICRPIPHDEVLPLARLLDPEVMAAVLAPALGGEMPSDVSILHLRYKPARRLLVHYEVTAGGAAHGVVALADRKADLAAQAVDPEHLALAEKVAGRSPARTPLVYEPELEALIQWPPLDLKLQALAEPPERLRKTIGEAGVETESAADVLRLIKHKPMSRAVLRLNRHVVKIYADERSLERSVDAMRAVEPLPVRTARCEAVLPELRIAVQSLVEGRRPAGPADVAAQAGALLAVLHAAELEGLPRQPPAERLEDAADDAEHLAALVPSLSPRLEQLVRELELRMPNDDALVPCHGGFHPSQLLESNGELGIIDFDGICRAPAARDLGSYVASLIERSEDLPEAAAILDRLCEAYGSRPSGITWYLATFVLRRADRPFAEFREGWPDQVEERVTAAELALVL